ncbi:hypothetical protein R5W24_004469 [Gemmata sp. JC717]|uniref:hypothetical protein n=1 Tax=Gemmata algarum TaxID=2975278 RepID=UPI0021BB3C09|nr:hypothetical protein [Gemmata algarum]MDY3555327.1 hypothetical protein [Gemmata algarum]
MWEPMLYALWLLGITAGLLVNVRLAQWVWAAARDARDEHRAADLLPRLMAAHRLIRDQGARLKELEAKAEQVQRHLWGATKN